MTNTPQTHADAALSGPTASACPPRPATYGCTPEPGRGGIHVPDAELFPLLSAASGPRQGAGPSKAEGGGPAPPRSWTLELPRLRLLSANDRPHWARRASITRYLRQTTHVLAISQQMDPCVVVNLHLVADYIREGGYYATHKNTGPHGSTLAAIYLADLPLGAILVSEGLTNKGIRASLRELGTCGVFDREKAWHQCRKCFSRHVEAESRKFHAGPGCWRHCLWCDFRWKSGWFAPMTRQEAA